MGEEGNTCMLAIYSPTCSVSLRRSGPRSSPQFASSSGPNEGHHLRDQILVLAPRENPANCPTSHLTVCELALVLHSPLRYRPYPVDALKDAAAIHQDDFITRRRLSSTLQVGAMVHQESCYVIQPTINATLERIQWPWKRSIRLGIQ